MAEPTFVRVFRPSGAQQVTEARIALEGSGIPFFIENEQFLGMTGLPFALGHAETWVSVAEEDAEEAIALLEDWFVVDEPPPAPDPGHTILRYVAAPFLFVLGLFGFTGLAIGLGRRIARSPGTEDDSVG